MGGIVALGFRVGVIIVAVDAQHHTEIVLLAVLRASVGQGGIVAFCEAHVVLYLFTFVIDTVRTWRKAVMFMAHSP